MDGDAPTSAPAAGRWKTRTDRNLKKGGKGGDSSDEEDLRLREGLGASVSAPVMQNIAVAGPGPSTSRTRKRLKRGSVQVPPRATAKEVVDDRGYMSEGDGETVRGRSSKTLPPAVNDNDAEPPTPNGTGTGYGKLSRSNSKKTRPNGSRQLVSSTPAEVSLSRNSSMSKQSVMSAPATSRQFSLATTNVVAATSPPGRRRIASLDRSPSKSSPNANIGSHRASSVAPPSRSKTTGHHTNEPGMDLMSIVEDVRKNRDMFANQQDPNRLLVLPKAPPPVSELLEWEEQKERDAKQAEENLRSIAAAAAASSSEPPTPSTPNTTMTTASIPAETEQHPTKPVMHSPPDKTHAVKPLRSALRNHSRTPSPAQSPPLPPLTGPSKLQSSTAPAPHANGFAKPEPVDDGDDTASISSYETGHETPDEPEERMRSPSPIAPLPPPNDEKPAAVKTSDVSNSTDSTATETTGKPRRTKSVRMSLPPTFSATPPAIDENDDGTPKGGSGRHEPWSSSAKRRSRPAVQDSPVALPNGGSGHARPNGGGWTSRIAETPVHKDVWEDSSEEDEEYGKAKKLLNRFSRKG